MKKIAVLVLVLALAGGVGFYFWKVGGKGSAGAGGDSQTGPGAGFASETGEPEGPLPTVQVKKGPMRQTVQCTGRVVSNLDVDIKCKASGQVVKLPFDISNKVQKGELIVEIDPVDQLRGVQQAEAAQAASHARLAQSQATVQAGEKTLEADRIRAQASIKTAEAKVADTAAKARREQALYDKKQSSIEELETAQTTATLAVQDLATAKAQIESIKAEEAQLEVKRQDVKVNQAEVDSDRIALEVANQRLTETKVMAPMDGVVSARTVQIGQIIASGVTNVGGGTAVLTLSDLSRMYILASVDESDIGIVALEQPAAITADAFPHKRFKGTVNRIAAKGLNVSNVITFEVRIEVLSDNKTMLKPEMTTNIEIIIAEKEETLSIPLNAITRTREGTFATLVKDDGTSEQAPVELGMSDGNNVEVVKGLEADQHVRLVRSESDSRWRQGSQSDSGRARMMMMRSMGGGGGGRR